MGGINQALKTSLFFLLTIFSAEQTSPCLILSQRSFELKPILEIFLLTEVP